jgi:Protein of Unknown function (DUF2784)
MNYYGALADFVVFVHLLYMGYVAFGQLVIMIGWPLGWRWIRNPWFRGTHLAMILVVAIEGTQDFECPLTTWEKDLRKAAGQNFRGTDNDEASGISFTGQMLRRIQFAGNNWEEYVNTSFYIAAAVIVSTFLLVPPRQMRLIVGVNLIGASLVTGALFALTGDWSAPPEADEGSGINPLWWQAAVLCVGFVAGVICLMPRKSSPSKLQSEPSEKKAETTVTG